MEGLTFAVEDVPSQRLLSATTVATEDELGEKVGRVLAAVIRAARGRVEGPPVCVFRDGFGPGRIVAELGVPYAGEPPYGFAISKLPPGRALVARLRGPYDQLGEAWRATMAHLAEQGVEAAGAPYERYCTPPGAAAPDAYLTELIVPIREPVTARSSG